VPAVHPCYLSFAQNSRHQAKHQHFKLTLFTTALSITTFTDSIITLWMIVLSKKIVFSWVSQCSPLSCRYAQCHYYCAKCDCAYRLNAELNVLMLTVIIMLSTAFHVIMLSVVTQGVIKLCRYGDWRYIECRGASPTQFTLEGVDSKISTVQAN
jgi:hypothetical protein